MSDVEHVGRVFSRLFKAPPLPLPCSQPAAVLVSLVTPSIEVCSTDAVVPPLLTHPSRRRRRRRWLRSRGSIPHPPSPPPPSAARSPISRGNGRARNIRCLCRQYQCVSRWVGDGQQQSVSERCVRRITGTHRHSTSSSSTGADCTTKMSSAAVS